ncbi:MAG: hypothetical protein KDB14_33095 [Planctomycetales bacterium]|nr:hypothetical protein [Planctomycetales bacterium]
MAKKRFTGVDFRDALIKLRGVEHVGTVESADDFLTAPTPEELHAIYSDGFIGASPDFITFEERNEVKDYLASMPRLYDVFPWARGIGKGKLNAPFLACLHFSPSWGGDEAQTRGSCVSHSNTNAAEIDHANDALHGETVYKGRMCKENIYRARGYNGDGWYCSPAAKYVGPGGQGGFLVRDRYESPTGEVVDLSEFSRATENWAGQGSRGCPEWLEAIARRNQCKWIIPINSMEEYRDSMALGFGVSVCSGYGYSSETDSSGVARQTGSWAHAMAHACCDDTPWANQKYGGMLGLIIQSWARWNRQNGKFDGLPSMPVGSFGARGNDVAKMIRSDSFALAGLYGWERIGWEAFDVTALTDHLQSSDVQDFYKARQERSAEFATKCRDEGVSQWVTV